MNHENVKKYQPYPPLQLTNRSWPDKQITQSPMWCSVDLRDGNQALITPMTLEEKLAYFKLLVNIGFKEIEVGFPSAAAVEFDFLRTLIEQQLIPEDVKIQVLVQAREHLIKRTFEALIGAKQAIVHMYNPTSTNQRKIVFKKNQAEIKEVALQGIRWIKQYAQHYSLNVQLEYSPESFTGTEIDYALDVCNAVVAEWSPTPENKLILNLPATMELATPNIYADQIEWMGRNLKHRDRITLSIHAHNDRGTAVAATELAMLAGADRVEGTLFGNGERTGNADILTLALNLYTQGVNPNLNFHDMNHVIDQVEKFNKMLVPERHPYAGSLVYTAFSGSHQDAIKKGMEYQKQKTDDPHWEVPYLPIDPADLGRSYEGIIRINSQSGKGGVAYILEEHFGYQLPKDMHPEFAKIVQAIADQTGQEVNNEQIYTAFNQEYLLINSPISFVSFEITCGLADQFSGKLVVNYNGRETELIGSGNGPIDACKNALAALPGLPAFNVAEYYEHALSKGSTSKAIAYIEIENPINYSKCFGVGIDSNIIQAAIKSLISGLNRSIKQS